MISLTRRKRHARVQAAARETLAEVANKLRPGLSEADIVRLCEASFAARGIVQTWYHDVLALVLVGERTLWSGSGSAYRPRASAIARTGDLVTIDLMPCLDGVWGDCARSFVIGGVLGKSAARGIEVVRRLHELFMLTASPDTTLQGLHETIGAMIVGLGYRSLDFKGNLGHSIESRRKDRRFVEPGCSITLREIGLLAFEPHIAHGDEPFGFKHEEIYYLGEEGQFLAL